jgi:cobalt-zinc-cadmium efflux system outer membrane protein
LELADQLLRIARDAQTAADRLHRAGETSRVDLRQAEIEVFSAENMQNDARTRHFAAWQSLRAVLGAPWLNQTALLGDLEAVPAALSWDEALARLLATSPELATAAANVERARAALVRARREPIPNLRYQLAVMQDLGIDGKTDGIVQALLPLPLINRNQGGISQATAELGAAEQAVQQVQLDLQNRLAGVYQRYSSAEFRVRRFRESILPAARDQLELVQKGYAGGELAFLNLLNAQRTYFQTHQQYLQAILELRTATVQIEGNLLDGSLQARP